MGKAKTQSTLRWVQKSKIAEWPIGALSIKTGAKPSLNIKAKSFFGTLSRRKILAKPSRASRQELFLHYFLGCFFLASSTLSNGGNVCAHQSRPLNTRFTNIIDAANRKKKPGQAFHQTAGGQRETDVPDRACRCCGQRRRRQGGRRRRPRTTTLATECRWAASRHQISDSFSTSTTASVLLKLISHAHQPACSSFFSVG